jgi:hypothetical protein
MCVVLCCVVLCCVVYYVLCTAPCELVCDPGSEKNSSFPSATHFHYGEFPVKCTHCKTGIMKIRKNMHVYVLSPPPN